MQFMPIAEFEETKLTVKVQVADGVYTFVSVSVPGAITAK